MQRHPNFREFTMRRLFAFVFVICVLGGPCFEVRADSNWDFLEFKQATEAYRRGDCKAAWDVMWPLAKAGRYEAVYFLWSSMVERMVPPGRAVSSPDSVAWHMLTLATYAAAGPKGPMPFQGDPNHRWARREIPLLLNRLHPGDAGKNVADCYRSDPSFEQCLKLAIAAGVVQRFGDYAAAVDAETRKMGNGASCRPRH
jgi:hypothetical protein